MWNYVARPDHFDPQSCADANARWNPNPPNSPGHFESIIDDLISEIMEHYASSY